MTDKTKAWALERLERFAIFVCTTAIALGSFLLWENYKTNEKITVVMQRLEKNDARQDQEIAQIKGQMVGWDTLKRIELFLSTHPENMRGKMLGDAIRMEVDTRHDSR